MLKIFIFLSIFILNVFAQTITFKEEKFLNALQTSVYKDGKIDFKKDYIEVSYKNLNTSYIFFDDHFISKDNQTEQRLNYEDRVELNLFYKLINFIYKDKKDGIEEFFKLQEIENKMVLIPNEYLSNSISKIEFKKVSNKLEFLKIYFKNEDYIQIVQN